MKRGGGQPLCIRILYVLVLFKGSFGLFNAYLVAFGLFLPKTEEFFFKIPTIKYLKKIIKNSKCG